MPTLASSTEILAGANDLAALTRIARELGFTAPPLPLDTSTRSTLGIPPAIDIAYVARGTGALRALLLQVGPECDTREMLGGVVAGLARHSAQLLWVVFASGTESVTLLCSSAGRSRPRIASLVCKRNRVYASDAETLCSLSAAVSEFDVLTYARWLDILGRESITRQFFRALEETVATMAASLPSCTALSERRELALVYVSRLIFLSFLQTKGWLDGDFGFLENGFARCMEDGGRYQKRVLEPLFFGTLNTRVGSRASRAKCFGRVPFLNGGLFARSSLEKRARRIAFSDESVGGAFGSLLSHYRFSGREDSTDWSEASIDPEILGKAFEALMAAENRKGSGAFYTPQDLVEHVTEEALSHVVSDRTDLSSLQKLRVLDPACGSGAFLVYMLEQLAKSRHELGETGSTAELRRKVLASSIFGVDLNPTAVWLCELRLWLSVVVESEEIDPMRVVPLPNLDRHIRVGDSLAGGAFRNGSGVSGSRLQALRSRYMRATGTRKLTLGRALDRSERGAAIDATCRSVDRLAGERKELLLCLRSRDLFGERSNPTSAERTRLAEQRRQIRAASHRIRALRAGAALPFSFEAHFSDAAAAGGFDIVIGNPPWVRLHRIMASSREILRREFAVYREAAWRSGAAMSGAGRGFAAQVDMAALFVERSHDLLKPRGIMAFLLPAKLWRSLAGGGMRNLLATRGEVLVLEDHADAKSGFDAAVYPSLLVCRARSSPRDAGSALRCEVHARGSVIRWEQQATALALDDTPGSPWIIVPPDVRRAFERMRAAGTPLVHSSFGRPLLGVKTGYNEAFLVRVESETGDIATIRTHDHHSTIETAMLRPVVRGESLLAPDSPEAGEHIIWPHDPQGRPLETLPPLAARWLGNYRRQLSRRTDLHNSRRWWSLFRVESACSNCPRVVWVDIGKRPRALVIEKGDGLVPLNTCYAVRCPSLVDARALAALLNGPLVAAWLDVIAEPARGGYRRYLGWTMALLPIPSKWDTARVGLSSLSRLEHPKPSDSDLLRAALSAYGLTRQEAEPLLEWMDRSRKDPDFEWKPFK